MNKLKLAIDVGGTFTDVVLFDPGTGLLDIHKVLSTNEDPSFGSLQGARALLERRGLRGEHLAEFIHATTVGTNTVIERKGAVTALITTCGFRDTLEIRNEDRYDIYDLLLQQPLVLVPRHLRREVHERIDVRGRVVQKLSADEVRSVLQELRAEGVQSVAVCLINAHVNPVHEQLIAEVAKDFPELALSVSHQIANEAREFERTSTCSVDAYVKPVVKGYIEKLARGLRELGLRGEPALMLSNGGLGSAVEVANSYPVRMIESGPAAGAVLAAHLSRTSLNQQSLIALDIGGTTAKVSLIQQGRPNVAHVLEVAHLNKFRRGSGFPLQIAAIELLEISGGGGSIARLNELDGISVGPDSAGAMPGPVAFGKGGQRPTVTDCDLILGYLNPQDFAGGSMTLDLAAARRAVEKDLAGPLKITVERAAQGVIDLINERMAAAVRVHAAEKGVDLRQFALVAFGGNGPLHAFGVARTLGIRTLCIPVAAGVASAIGCVVSEPAIDYTEPIRMRLAEADWLRIDESVAAFLKKGSAALGKFVSDGQIRARVSLDLRCVGQGYNISVELPDYAVGRDLTGECSQLFHSRYTELYGHPPPDVPVEIVNLRTTVFMPREGRRVMARERPGESKGAVAEQRDIFLDGRWATVPVYLRTTLPRDRHFSGPALIVEKETTTLVGQDASFYRHGHDHIVVDLH